MIHVVTGPPCAGKTTYVRDHAEKGDVIIDFDAIASAIGAEDHAAAGAIFDVAVYARRAAINTAIEKDYEVWIIDTNHTERFAENEDLVELDPGYDVCMERAKQDGRPQQTINGIEGWYAARKGYAMKHLYKSFELVKSDDDAGKISGYFSTYDRIPDSYGDVIAKGAFAETIAKRKESGHPFPLCWNHDLNQIIGSVDPADIEDTENGPLMMASFFDTQLAQEKRAIVKSGVVYQFSYAYDILEAGPVVLEDGTKANELRKIDLFEISIVPVPANQRAVVTDVKAGKRNSKKDADAIREAITLLQGVLGELEEAEAPEDGEDKAKANGAPEEPERSNPEKERLLNFIKTINEKKEN